jgi:hypothetical protein
MNRIKQLTSVYLQLLSPKEKAILLLLLGLVFGVTATIALSYRRGTYGFIKLNDVYLVRYNSDTGQAWITGFRGQRWDPIQEYGNWVDGEFKRAAAKYKQTGSSELPPGYVLDPVPQLPPGYSFKK